MRNAILATAFIAVTAGALAIGVTQGDKIKSLFASEELYKNNKTAEATTTPSSTSTTTASITPTDTSSIPTQTPNNDQTASASTTNTSTLSASDTTNNIASTDAATAQQDNQQTPAAGDATAATPEAAAPAATDEKAGSYKFDLAKALVNRSIGSESAPLTINEYFSLTCPHCAHFNQDVLPKIKEDYIDKGKVRWVFHTFPLNEPALKADMVARCAPNDQYIKLVDFMFQNQERWAFTSDPMTNLAMLLKVAGITDDIFLTCANDKDLETALVKQAQADTTKYKINATPTFIFNDGLKNFSGAGTYEGFKYDIDKALNSLGQGPAPIPSASDAAETPAAAPQSTPIDLDKK